jgi:hypothetical protein
VIDSTMSSRPILAVPMLLAAALSLSVAGCDRSMEDAQEASRQAPGAAQPAARQVSPLQIADSRWVSVAEPAPYVDVAVDTDGIVVLDGHRVAWVRQRLNRPLVVEKRTADTLIELRRFDCDSGEWGMMEFILALHGAEVSRGARPLKMMDADRVAKDRQVLDLVCAAVL